MKLWCYDDDGRIQTEGYNKYILNAGSFATITHNLNQELNTLGKLGTEQEADTVIFTSGLKWDFGFSHRTRVLINVWESNILPEILIAFRKRLEKYGKYHVMGLSDQISNLWTETGYHTPTVDIGADTEFWKPSLAKKADKFTILSVTSCNFRSGIEQTIGAFIKAADKDNDMRLIIKNTDERAKRLPFIIEDARIQGYDIQYICRRMNLMEIRDLMASSHVLAYNVHHTSAGLPVLEAAAMELPCIVGNFCPTNGYPVCETLSCLPVPITRLKPYLCGEWGLPYTFDGLGVNEDKAFLYWFEEAEFAEKLLKMKHSYANYIEKAKECRKQVLERWTWKHSCEQLITNLRKIGYEI